MEYLESLRLIAQEYGLWAAIVVYFVVRDAVRDNRQHKTITGLQDEMRQVILPIVTKAVETIATNTEVMKSTKSSIEDTVNDCREMLSKCRAALSPHRAPHVDRVPLVATGGD